MAPDPAHPEPSKPPCMIGQVSPVHRNSSYQPQQALSSKIGLIRVEVVHAGLLPYLSIQEGVLLL
jgi:hypothetical protein